MNDAEAMPPPSSVLEMPKSSTLMDELPVGAPDAEEVRGLEVAVDDAERVRVGDGDAGLEHELDRLLERERAALLEHGGEVAPLEVLHHHVRSAGLERADVEDAGHVLARDLHRGPGLAGEAGDDLRASEHLRAAGT